MQFVSHGIDLVECERIAQMMGQYPDKFLARILTDAERAYVETKRHPVPHVAGRFAAKEAILKVLGTGWRGQISWRDMEVLNDKAGGPRVTLTGECARIAERLGIARIVLSITHTQNYAAASAIGLVGDGESSS
ncbi:MAG: holo-ACP synthase [Phycisphaerae bacterium]|nr:holo-ACP synthase [Phycisphaerae bacterium]